MKRILAMTTLAVAAAVAAPAMAADVGVSINIGQPGFFGQIDIGAVQAPPPALIYTQPVLIEHPAYAPPPVYLHVPPGYERHWGRHCAEYGACGRPVYFVRDDWYRREYAPRYQERYSHDRGDERHDEGHGHGHDHGDHADHDHGDHDRGDRDHQ